MATFVEVDGRVIEIPPAVESDGPEAVAAYLKTQSGKAKAKAADKE